MSSSEQILIFFYLTLKPFNHLTLDWCQKVFWEKIWYAYAYVLKLYYLY